ncbi:MAG: hypothetical protein LBT04_00575 [Prevotellaceae bacterium]|jgi:hypothetical protein|nr:hypothetical protein [Prevotellaceae bacterium]
MQDANATADTKNRKVFDGMYFEQAMIPKEAYSEEDFENNNFFSFLGFGSSQFDKDRTEYVGNAGDYSDNNFFERTWESMKEEGLANKTVEILSVVLFKGKGGKVTNALKGGQGKGERGHTKSASGTNNPYKHLRPDPQKTGNVLEKDTHTGQWKSKKAPEGYVFPQKK